MNCFGKIILSVSFSGLWVETFRAFGEKICGILFEKASYLSRGMIRGKQFFKDWFFWEILNFELKLFYIGGKISKVLSKLHSTCPEELFPIFERIWIFFPVSGGKCFGFLSRAFSAWLPKLYSTCVGKIFDENELFWKKECSRNFFRSLSGSFSEFWC